MTKVKRISLIVLVSIILVSAGLGSIALFGTYSEGTRVGRIVKFSKKGVVFKTYEGVGGLGKDAQGNIATDKWAFSVYRGDDEIIKKIEEAQSSNAVVELRYKEKFYQFSWRGDTKYFIEEVRPTSQP
jgi:hypothetical protein